jgi:hypothetical protein
LESRNCHAKIISPKTGIRVNKCVEINHSLYLTSLMMFLETQSNLQGTYVVGMVSPPAVPALQRQRQKNYEFEVSFG